MREGDLVLTPIPQANGQVKNRPVLVLREMPPFHDLLVCGISSQLHQQVSSFDETIVPSDPDFAASGLRTASLIRLGFLALLPRRTIIGSIGAIAPDRHARLLRTLSSYLIKDL
jgi:mRNA interferase MazF